MIVRSKLLRFSLLFVLMLGVGATTASAQLQQLPADKYIARMNHPGRDLKVNQVIQKLGLKSGDIVADIGSGSGLFSIPFAKAVAPKGTVYSVDIDPKMLAYVANRAKESGITNLKTVVGQYDDPKLPVKDVDVVFFHRVLHMIEHRQAYLDNAAKYLKPGGRIVVIDKNPQDSLNSWMWLKQSDVDSWMAAIGFYPAQHFGIYDDRYFVVYARPYDNSVLVQKYRDLRHMSPSAPTTK
jgi:arsenite methyltransferase